MPCCWRKSVIALSVEWKPNVWISLLETLASLKEGRLSWVKFVVSEMINSISFGLVVNLGVVLEFKRFTKLSVFEIPNRDLTSRLSLIFFLREFHFI